MRIFRLAATLGFAAALATGACTRAEQQETREEAAEETNQAQQQAREEKARLEARLEGLEKRWEDTQARAAKEGREVSATTRAEVNEAIAATKREIDEIDTVNAENWWERHERSIARETDEAERDVKRHAPKWTSDVKDDIAATVGTEETWEARRDRAVAAMQRRIDSMEQALRNIDGPDVDREDVEQTRARVRTMREENETLRKATDDDWWEMTSQRVTRYIDRLEDRIDALNEPNTSRR
jgi:hypothetical protein